MEFLPQKYHQSILDLVFLEDFDKLGCQGLTLKFGNQGIAGLNFWIDQ